MKHLKKKYILWGEFKDENWEPLMEADEKCYIIAALKNQCYDAHQFIITKKVAPKVDPEEPEEGEPALELGWEGVNISYCHNCKRFLSNVGLTMALEDMNETEAIQYLAEEFDLEE